MIRLLHNRPLPKDIARDRLKVIIINDREGITPYILDIIRSEILTIISKYINIDTNKATFDLINNSYNDNKQNHSSLVAKIPLYRNSK
ncbi:cell division topological specificity factor MinE [Candidatus Arthromitus sp. SFB-rat-Yit]|uniref:cell division topological specificity factor MinE n=1 Tax=Candidatus Arthromitus sp. SFB-rat-Yit TaxID=1041504 RepID=UPI000227A3DE|nr:cell division topological specificity factor MinE [Candidatus Arthromitus sp. SFB-rat-Yit]BAK80895.1 cell division topological specificity factor MinE [Candidatus Arthromitus sp. SFB-rat-Yit]